MDIFSAAKNGQYQEIEIILKNNVSLVNTVDCVHF